MGRKQKLKESRKKQQTKKNPLSTTSTERGTLYYIVYLGLIILLLYPPYFRGMFFEKEFLPTHMYTGVLFLTWMIYKGFIKQEQPFFKSPMDYAALALVGAYFISCFVAVNIRSGIGELLKYMNYFMAFYLVSDFARTKQDMKTLLWAMVMSAFGVAFIGIGAAAGTFTYNGAFVGGRINSTIQYPNTLAAYLTAAFMISTALWATAQERWQRGILSFVNYTLFLCFLFTLSRAAWLMFPVFFLILILGMPGEYRMKVLGYSIQTFAASILASPGFGMAISASQEKNVWMWYIIGAAAAFIFFYIFEKISERFALHIKPKVILSVLILIIFLGGIGGYIAFTTEAPLTISHGEDEEESWKTHWYPIDSVKPDTEYTIRFTVSTKPSPKEVEWGAGVLVNSIDDSNNSVRIVNEYINENLNGETREVTFTTRPDTKSLSIGFSNRFPGTEATFTDVEYYETQDISSARRIVLAYKYIPQAISRRISSISTGDSSFTSRLTFYRDALKIIKDHPILGIGGGGWKAIYFAYQSYSYFTTEVHSFFMQLWVETGTLGFLVLITLWFFALYTGFKVVSSDMDAGIKTLTWGALTGAVALGGHSLVDFNLSLGAVALYLWQLLGIIKAAGVMKASVDKQSENKPTKKSLIRPHSTLPAWAFNALAALFVLSSFFLHQGYTYGQQAVDYIRLQDLLKAKEAFEKATKYDPFTSSFKADLAQIEEVIGSQTENEAMIERGWEYRLAAIRLDPYNAKLQTQLAQAYLAKGELEEGLKALEKATEINPHNISLWEDLADAYEKVAELYIRQDKKDEALRVIDKSQRIFEKVANINLNTPKSARQKLEISNNLMLYIYKARLLAENIDNKDYYKKLDRLVFASDFTLDTDHNGVPDLWNTSNSQKGYIKTEVTEEYTVITNEGEGQSYLLTKQDFSLEPDTSYTVKMLASGDVPKDKLQLNIYSREGKNPQYQWKSIELSPEISEITTSFTTSEDLVEGKQWLRIHIQPSTQKKMALKMIEIWKE